MFSNYRKSLLTTAIALALASASGAAFAGKPCEDDQTHHANMPSQANKHGQSHKSGQAYNKPGQGNMSRQASMSNQEISAARQESQIETTYALSSNLRNSDLKVSVEDGKATLTGTVEEEVSKELANAIALGADGINSVDNQIKVESDYAPATRTSQERNFGEVVEDASITATVKSKLLWSNNTEGLDMDVDTTNGRVTLSGNAESDADKARAATMAANTHGVKSVDNRLVVDSTNAVSNAANNDFGQDASREISDGWITTKVNSTLMYSANVQSNDIDVSTDDGVVTLTGTVRTNDERDQAIELAENIRGVKSVTARDLKLSNRSAGLTGAGLTQNLSNPEGQ